MMRAMGRRNGFVSLFNFYVLYLNKELRAVQVVFPSQDYKIHWMIDEHLLELQVGVIYEN